jgi:hypothetical protein
VNSVEQAIRAALNKGDNSDPTFRRRIYASASSALERSLTARPYTEIEMGARRQSLAATIKHIESEFRIAVENTAVAPHQPVEQAPQIAAFENTPEPALTEQKSVPIMKASVETADMRERVEVKPVIKPTKIVPPRKSRPWTKYALNGGFLIAMLIGGIWAYSEGKRVYTEATASEPSGKKPVLAEANGVSGGEQIDWIQIFSTSDTDLVTAPQGAKAEITSRDGTNVVTMTGDSSNEVAVKIGAGLMQNFAGKRVLFNFKARSANSTTLETGAHCNFGAETKCERKRFKIGPEAAEYMFVVIVAGTAKEEGSLLIAPDLTGSGGAVEIESIRATIVKPDAG